MSFEEVVTAAAVIGALLFTLGGLWARETGGTLAPAVVGMGVALVAVAVYVIVGPW